MNVNRNLNSQAKQLHSTENTGKKSRIGRSGVEKGNPTAKSKNVLKTFFGRVGKAITSRLATIKAKIRSNNISRSIKSKGQFKDDSLDKLKELILKNTSLDQIKKGDYSTKLLTQLFAPEEIKSYTAALKERYTNGTTKEGGKVLKTGREVLLDDFAEATINKEVNKLEPRWASNVQQSKELLRLLTEGHLPKDGHVPSGSIFRDSSSLTRFSAAFARTFDQGYTAKVLLPTMTKLVEINTSEDTNQEGQQVAQESGQLVDRIEDSVDQVPQEDTNQKGQQVAQEFGQLVDRIAGSVDQVPQEICDQCAILYQAVINAGGDRATALSGSVVNTIALRLLNPTLTAPKGSVIDQNEVNKLNIGDKGPPNSFRLVSKAFQLLANGKTEVAKDENLKPFEDLLKDPGMISKWNGFMEGVLKRGGVVLEPQVNVPQQPENNPVQQGGGLNNPEVRREELEVKIGGLQQEIEQTSSELFSAGNDDELKFGLQQVLNGLFNDLEQARGELNSLDQEPQEVQKQPENNPVQQGGGLNNNPEVRREGQESPIEMNQGGNDLSSEGSQKLDGLNQGNERSLQELDNLDQAPQEVQKQPENNPVQQGGGLNDPEVRRKELEVKIGRLEQEIEQTSSEMDQAEDDVKPDYGEILNGLINDLEQARGELNSLNLAPQEVQKQPENNRIQPENNRIQRETPPTLQSGGVDNNQGVGLDGPIMEWHNFTDAHPSGVCEGATIRWLNLMAANRSDLAYGLEPEGCDDIQSEVEGRGSTFATVLAETMQFTGGYFSVEQPLESRELKGDYQVNQNVLADQLNNLAPGEFCYLQCRGLIDNHAMVVYRDDANMLHFFDPNKGMWNESATNEGRSTIQRLIVKSSEPFGTVESIKGRTGPSAETGGGGTRVGDDQPSVNKMEKTDKSNKKDEVDNDDRVDNDDTVDNDDGGDDSEDIYAVDGTKETDEVDDSDEADESERIVVQARHKLAVLNRHEINTVGMDDEDIARAFKQLESNKQISLRDMAILLDLCKVHRAGGLEDVEGLYYKYLDTRTK